MSANRSRLLLLLAALLFSTGGAALKALSLSPFQRAGFRSAIAAAFLLLVLPETRRLPSWPTVLVGGFYAWTVLTFVLANTFATAATAIFVQGLAPLVVLLFSPSLLGERVRRRDVVFMAWLLLAFGFLVAAPESASATAPDPGLGLACAAASCVGWSATVLGLRRLARGSASVEDRSPQALVVGNALACTVALPLALPVSHVGVGDVVLICYLGVFQIGLAYLCFVRGLRQVPALEASLLLMLEPILNPVWTWLVHREEPHPLTLFGGGIVVGATVLHALSSARARAAGGELT